MIAAPRERITRAIGVRRQTDSIVSLALVWGFILGTVGIVAAQFALLFFVVPDYTQDPYFTMPSESSTLAILGIILAAGNWALVLLSLYLYYKLLRRQNDHYARERNFRASVISLVEAAADTPERRWLVDGDLMAMNAAHRVTERRRATWFWVSVAALPLLLGAGYLLTGLFVNWPTGPSAFVYWLALFVPVAVISVVLEIYMFWFLSLAMQDHDARWRRFSISSRNALSKLGFPQSRRLYVKSLPERNFVLYLLLSLLTGVFFLYWFYVLVKDPNEHFKSQWVFEDNLMRDLGAARSPASSGEVWR